MLSKGASSGCPSRAPASLAWSIATSGPWAVAADDALAGSVYDGELFEITSTLAGATRCKYGVVSQQ